MTYSVKWNEVIIREKFLPQDAEDIIKIPLGNDRSKDEIIWPYNKKGNFIVRSAYKLWR